MKAVIYCRVSTEDQEKEGTSLKTQLADLDNTSYDEKIELLDMLAINANATVDVVDVKGVIPMKITPSDVESASTELTHH
jgi:hypothetical protein